MSDIGDIPEFEDPMARSTPPGTLKLSARFGGGESTNGESAQRASVESAYEIGETVAVGSGGTIVPLI